MAPLLSSIANTGKMALDWRNWLYGLLSGSIGGMASTGAALLGMSAAKGVGMEIQIPHWKEMGIMMVSSGLAFAFAYLKQSPLPSIEQTTTTTATLTTVTTASAATPPTP